MVRRISRLPVLAFALLAAPKSEPFVRTALPTARPMWIELSEPVTAQGPYGIEKKVRWISVAVDEAEEFRQALEINPEKG